MPIIKIDNDDYDTDRFSNIPRVDLSGAISSIGLTVDFHRTPLGQDSAQINSQRLIKEGKTLETPEDNLAELTAQAEVFQDKLLPILKAHLVM